MLNLKLCAPLSVCVVFINLMRLCRGQAGPFGFLNYQNVDPSSQFQQDFPYPYPTGSQQIGMQAPQQAFMDLLSPICPPLFPPNLMMIKSKLCDLIMSNQLEVGPVMDYLVKFQHLDQFDLMIAGLLALRDTLPVDCPLRQELGQLIVHSIFKRCQARLMGGNGDNIRPLPPPVITTPPPEPPQQLSCDTIINMLNYFQNLFDQYNCQQCLPNNNNAGPGFNNLYPQFTKRNSQQAHKRRSVDMTRTNLLEKPPLYGHSQFEQLIELLPQPQNEIESLKYNKVKMLLKSNEIRTYLKDITVTNYSNKQELLNLVLNKVAQSNMNASIKEAFNFYLHYGNHTSATTETAAFDFSALIDLLPQPLDNEEREKFELVKSFLSRKDIHKYLKNIDASVYNDKKLLFKTILKAIVASKIDVKTTEAFTYYLNYQESLTALELYTKKEITKHFELTKIFIDTLDIDSLSNDAKLAFKKFFKFISNITKDQIKNFDSWSEVKTKGEFMKALFKYLLAQAFVPPEVKESITKLEPLVKMDGRGAAPP